jgi:hypothetical protein
VRDAVRGGTGRGSFTGHSCDVHIARSDLHIDGADRVGTDNDIDARCSRDLDIRAHAVRFVCGDERRVWRGTAVDQVSRERSFSFDAPEQLALPEGMTIGEGVVLDDPPSTVFGSVSVASDGPPTGRRSLLVFARAVGLTAPEISPTGATILPSLPLVFQVTNAFDLSLADDETYALGECRLGGADDRNVVAIVGPPNRVDDRGAVRGAHRAWRFTRTGLSELDPEQVTRELP